ncbi:ABC transporter permease [Pigmentiphaga sp. YJ18]|uniref:ABC transporter permease n=1 Tax=unclassified Pigmentiphaga TaxID=2626614 RepID=UPI001375AFF3|nr:ABC transporter permease [Pigmentiphaga sp. H8]
MNTLSAPGRAGSRLFNAYIVGICLLLVFPLAVVALISFDTSSHIGFPPKGLHLEWYRSLPDNANFLLSFKNSLIVALASTAIAVLVAVPAAILVTRFRFRGRGVLYAMLMSSLTVPWIVYGVALLLLWTHLGLRLGLDTLIFGHAVIGAPYVLRTSVAVLADMPMSYERGARSLGAGPLRTFFTITLPLMMPGLKAGAAFAFIVSFVNIPVSLFVTTADNITVPVAVFNYMQYNFDPGVAAFSMVQLIIIALFIGFAVRAAKSGALA